MLSCFKKNKAVRQPIPAPENDGPTRNLGDDLAGAIRESQVSLSTRLDKNEGKITFSIPNNYFLQFPQYVQTLLSVCSTTTSQDVMKFEISVQREDDCECLMDFFTKGITPPPPTRGKWETDRPGYQKPELIIDSSYSRGAIDHPDMAKGPR